MWNLVKIFMAKYRDPLVVTLTPAPPFPSLLPPPQIGVLADRSNANYIRFRHITLGVLFHFGSMFRYNPISDGYNLTGKEGEGGQVYGRWGNIHVFTSWLQ